MKLLALDAATTSCSVACWSGDAVIAGREEIASRRQAEILMPMVEAALNSPTRLPHCLPSTQRLPAM